MASSMYMLPGFKLKGLKLSNADESPAKGKAAL